MYELMHQHYRISIRQDKRFCIIALVIIPLLFLTFKTAIHAQSVNNLIFVQIPAQKNLESLDENFVSGPTDRHVHGARIVLLLSSSSVPVNLTAEFYAACDPDLSFDGESIIFAGKKDVDDRWQIWRMKIDGSNKEQITNSDGDCISPVHAGNRFYLNDPQPTPQIIYVSTAHGWKNDQQQGPVFSLYGTDPEGKSTHRLTFNLYSDYSPDVLPNGRIVFTSRQYNGKNNQAVGRCALLAVNNDGTDLMPFYGNHEMPRYKDMVHVSDFGHRVYFVESERSIRLGGGDIAYVSQRRPLNSYRKLSHSDKDLYHSPCPLPDNGLVASYRSDSIESEFSIYHIDTKSGERKERIFSEPGWHSIDAQVLTAHPNVKGRSNWLIPGSVSGVFYCINSYNTNLPKFSDINPGTIKYVRVVEGIPLEEKVKSSNYQHNFKNRLNPAPNFSPAQSPQRIVGVAPVENDGSFQVRVPAETPLTFQMLDKNYMAIRTQNTWTLVMGNENRGCIGCHENRELSPPNIMIEAVTKPPVELISPVEQRRIVDFRNQIAPVIASKCAISGCHISGQVRPNLEGSENTSHQVYDVLLMSIPGREKERYVIPGNAKASSLIWHLSGKRLALDKSDYTTKINLMPPDSPLKLHERILFIEWIDLGAQWYIHRNITSDINEDQPSSIEGF
jgi:hypothetical protein